MIKYGCLGVLICFFILQVGAQTPEKIKVEARKTPLNQVLLDLKEDYGFQFAFDNDLLSNYRVSINRTFRSKEETLLFLVRNLPLRIEKSGDVFLIIPQKKETQEPAFTHISGQVVEANTFEPLPYSYILINQKPVQSDQHGHFNFIASADTSFNLQISHLGYLGYDTIVTRSLNRRFFLTPQIERIKEVKIVSNPVEKATLIGDKAGRMKINHQIAPILPGHGDNSVFNLLRLMPGIWASGEQSNDLLIWGAYESHSKIQFDGFTVFGLKNFNDNISIVNPFMVKNIEVMKGAYEARYGGRVGGIVDITGKDGSLFKPGFAFNINSNTVNSMLQVPLSGKSSIMAAYRQTYYQLYDPTNYTFFFKKKDNNNGQGEGNQGNAEIPVVFDVTPDFSFRDLNLKYTFKGNKGDRFSVSLYGGGDDFQYDMESQVNRTLLTRTEEEENNQLGGSIQFQKAWSKGWATHITLAYSSFFQEADEINKSLNTRTGIERITRNVDSENTVNELTFNLEHTLSFKDGHKLIVAAGAIQNSVELSRLWQDEAVLDFDDRLTQLTTYVQDELPLGKHLELKAGLRTEYVTEFKKWYFEPRFSASLKVVEGLKLNASWGIYNQFMSKTIIVDSTLNLAKVWINANGDNIAVLDSEHLVGGVSVNKGGFSFNGEVYYKTTDGITRYFRGNNRVEEGFYKGNARTYGIDLYFKQEYKRHMAWVSYTYSNSEEHFPYYIREPYRPSPHHQKHEVKVAGIANYKSFYLSANYIYGSGFERYNIETEEGLELDQPYKRLDASLVYKFKPGKVKAEAGISVLNVFDTENIKFSNLSVNTVDDISLVGVYSNAVPFTPAVFLKIEL